MSRVIDTESGPAVEIEIEEAAIPAIPVRGLEGDVKVRHEGTAKD